VALPFVPPSPIGNSQKSLSQERDRWFESGSLQRRVSNELLEGGVTSEPARPRVKATRGQNRRTKTRCAIAALAS